MDNVINIVRWKPTGEFLGYGRINEEGHQKKSLRLVTKKSEAY